MKETLSMAYYLVCIGLWAIMGCNYFKAPTLASPEGYDFAESEKIFLPDRLEEVSGISFVPGSDSLMMAVNDEEGRIFNLNLNHSKSREGSIRFSGNGDFEDLSFLGGKWQVLQSNGTIHTVDKDTLLESGENAPTTSILPKGEYEGMAAFGDSLYVICKQCPQNKNTESTIFVLHSNNDSLVMAGTRVLNTGNLGGDKKKKYLASGLAKHPGSGDWYILSHLQSSLVVTDHQFRVKQFIPLLRSKFSQPEGIAFASNGDLLISNEGDGSAGYILRFKYSGQ